MSNYSTDEYLKLRDASVWIIKGLLAKGSKLLMMGEPKTGKSYLALQLAAAVSCQSSFLHFPVLQKGPVYYLQLDMSRGEWKERLVDLRPHLNLLNVRWGDKEANPYRHPDNDPPDLPWPFDITNMQHARVLRESIFWAGEPLLVIVDVLRKVHRGSEDDSAHMQDVIDCLQEVAAPAAIGAISHTRKSSADRSTRNDNAASMNEHRGSSVVHSTVDVMLKVGQIEHVKGVVRPQLYLQGRSIADQTIDLVRQSSKLWATPLSAELTGQQLIELVQRVTTDVAFHTKLEKRNALMSFGVSAEQARQAVP